MAYAINILIIEDEAVLAMDLTDLLEEEGYTVIGTANNGPKALRLHQQHRLDLALCDISIKGDWDGIETVEHLLAHRPIPIIFMTALTDKATLERAMNTRPAAYLIKPVTVPGLRAAVELALRNFSQAAQPPGSGPVAPPASLPPGGTRERSQFCRSTTQCSSNTSTSLSRFNSMPSTTWKPIVPTPPW